MKALTVLVLALAFVLPPRQLEPPCNLTDAIAARVTNYRAWSRTTRQLPPEDRAALSAFVGVQDWVGYEQGGFAETPADWPVYGVALLMPDGATRYVFLYAMPDGGWYHYTFYDLAHACDANGEHCGVHNLCGSGRVDGAVVGRLVG